MLEFGGTETDTTDSEDENLNSNGAAKQQKKFVKLMTGYKPKSIFEKKLILGVVHRIMHKNVNDES